MKKMILWIAGLVILGVVALVLASCESADNAAARKASAEALVIQAQTQQENERAANRIAQAEQSHRHFQENMPIILIVAGVVVLIPFLGAIVWWMMREQSMRQQQMILMMNRQPQLPVSQSYYPPVQVRGPMPAGLLENVRDKPVVIIHQE